jgi:hypothetical protein
LCGRFAGRQIGFANERARTAKWELQWAVTTGPDAALPGLSCVFGLLWSSPCGPSRIAQKFARSRLGDDLWHRMPLFAERSEVDLGRISDARKKLLILLIFAVRLLI